MGREWSRTDVGTEAQGHETGLSASYVPGPGVGDAEDRSDSAGMGSAL